MNELGIAGSFVSVSGLFSGAWHKGRVVRARQGIAGPRTTDIYVDGCSANLRLDPQLGAYVSKVTRY